MSEPTLEERVAALERKLAWYENKFCQCPAWGRARTCPVHGDFNYQGVPHIMDTFPSENP